MWLRSHFLNSRSKISVALIAVCACLLIAVSRPASAQSTTIIKYGQTLNGTITNAASGYGQLFQFTAQANDKIGLTVKRTSGDLRPAVGLFDQSLPSGSQLLTQGKLSSDGKTSAIVSFTIPHDGDFTILVTREGVDKGTTTGRYSLTLQKSGSSGGTPTRAPSRTPIPTITPTQPAAPPTVASNANVETFKVGTEPGYSVWNGNNLYVANQADGTVSILDGDGNETSTINMGGSPFAMAWDGARLWVGDVGTDNKGNTVNLFSDTGKSIASYKVGLEPFSLSYDADNQRMWIALLGDNKIVAVDPKGKIATTVDVSSAGNSPNTVLWTGNQLWATLSGTSDKPDNKVLIIDSTGNITNTVQVGQSPADLAWDDTDQIMFVANSLDNSLTTLDASGNVTGTYPVGKNPSALAWDGKHVWVTLFDDKAVDVLDTSGTILATIPLDTNPNGIAYDGLSSMWIALQGTNDKPGSEVARVDVASAVSQ